MNANKKKIILLLFFVFLCLQMEVYADEPSKWQVPGGNRIYENGENSSYADEKLFYDRKGNLQLAYCTQPKQLAPSYCNSLNTVLNNALSAGIDEIIKTQTNYVAIQKYITNFLYQKYSETYRDGYSNYNVNASISIYNLFKNDEYIGEVRFNKSSLNFSSGLTDTVTVTLPTGAHDYDCTVTNGTFEKNGTNLTVTSLGNGSETTLTCKPKIKFNKYHLYSDCHHWRSATDLPIAQEVVLQNGVTVELEGNPKSISGTAVGSIQITKTNSATGAPISNVGFTLYTDPSCSTVKKNEVKTNANGVVMFLDLNPATYYYKETTTPSNYVANTNCNAVTVTSGNRTSLSVTNSPYGTIQIKKQNSIGETLKSKTVKFGIYNNSNCNVNSQIYEFDCYTGGNGICSYSLPSGNYWIKETSAPTGYAVSDECVSLGTVSPNNTNSPVIYTNVTNCEKDLRNDNSIKNRLALYKTYGYKNLLNFDKNKISEACSAYDPNYGKTSGCLEVDQVNSTTEQKFKNTNLSDYNDTISASNSISYCLTDFEITKNVNFNTGITAGQMIININNNSALITGTLTKTCYIHKDDDSKYTITNNDYIKYDNYIKSVSVAGNVLRKQSTTSSLIIEDNGEFKKVVGTVTVKYAPAAVYAYRISGESCDGTNDDCTLIGYGVISKFNDATLVQPSFNFDFISNSTSIFTSSSNYCYYNVEPEIIKYNYDPKGKLDLEFRTIDTNNPFADRDTNTNWCNGNNCSSSNSTVIDVMNNNNSYNKTGNGPIYKITLTPSDILKIREYNANPDHYYDNYDIECKVDRNGDKKCVNSFLNEYKELGVIE